MLHRFHLRTNERSQMIDITEQVRSTLRQAGALEGLVIVYCPHTTAGITINEGADPDVARDILQHLNELFPWNHPQYRHREGNSAAHLEASMIGASQALPCGGGDVFDGTRQRTFFVKVVLLT